MRRTRHFWRVCHVFSSSSSPHLTSPLPHLPTLQTTLQTHCRRPFGHLQHIFFTTHNKYADFSISVAFSCVPSRQTRKCVPYGMHFYVQLHSLPIRTPMCPNGRVGALWQVLHSQTRKKSHMGRFFMSSYIPSPPEHHQCTQMGTLVVFGCLSSTPTPPSK